MWLCLNVCRFMNCVIYLVKVFGLTGAYTYWDSQLLKHIDKSGELQQWLRRRLRERQKSNWFNKQNNNFGTYSLLFVTFLCRRCTTMMWNFLAQRCLKGVNTRRQIFLSLSKLWCGPQRFTYICHFTCVSKLK